VALGPLDRQRLEEACARLSGTVGERIRALYQSCDERGQLCDVLYWFWVKQAPCPRCAKLIDLFPSRIIARNAYPDRKPAVQVCCPGCGDIFPALINDRDARCPRCALTFDPHQGAAAGASAACSDCVLSFSIVEAIRKTGRPPPHRLIGKLLLTPGGEKRYLPATRDDLAAYDRCAVDLRDAVARGTIRLPTLGLQDGHNTRQALNYNYRTWRDFFNDRQLLALSWLHAAIGEIPDEATRDALLTLFSGVLEFNNLFASYKGEGTGAVRHMFSHHILKPERMPIEANVWGTPKSSGSFSNLFKTRLLRAAEYRAAPFEVTLEGQGKDYHSSDSFSGALEPWPGMAGVPAAQLRPGGIYLSCGSSDATGLADQSIDLVVTDPPFFDNVHYSELADFFHAWQSLQPRGFLREIETTRHEREVQDADPCAFAAKLRAVFCECHRVLKDQGLLVFTYHHSRAEGWTSLMEAVLGAGFSINNVHPVKAEMSVATPKAQASEPIQLDIILVCRKRVGRPIEKLDPAEAMARVVQPAEAKADRLRTLGLDLSRGDCRIIIYGLFLTELSKLGSAAGAVAVLRDKADLLEAAAEAIRQRSSGNPPRTTATRVSSVPTQTSLWPSSDMG
jgi:putative DNA methylase